jgi:peptidyl-prolyl cis-trans isomerase D
MLQDIRDRAKGWLAWIIVLLISVPFALWGIQQYFGTDADVAVAVVNGTELDMRQFRQAYFQQRNQLVRLLGNEVALDLIDDRQLKHQTLQRLVENELLIQAASDQGLTISDAQIAQIIRAQETFQRDGAFSRELYEQWLQSQGYTPSGFEYELRRKLLTNQLHSAVANSAIVSERAVSEFLRLKDQERIYAQLVLPIDQYRDVKVSSKEIAHYYDEHRTEFVTPERINIEYIELSRDKIAQDIDVHQDELRSLYESEKTNYVVPEQRRASHILLSIPQDADEAQVAEVREQAELLRQRLLDNSAFAELAQEHSDDPGSRDKGGDLGFFSRGTMDAALEKAVFSMEVGEISKPIRSQYGFHLVKLTDIQSSRVKPFEDVRAELAERYREQKAEGIYFEQAEQLATLAFENPETLTVAANSLGLQVEETGLVARRAQTNNGLAANEKVLEEAFSPEVLEEGNNSDLLELDTDRAVVLRVKEHAPPTQRTLAQARDEIIDKLRSERAREQVVAVGRSLLHRLRSGGDKPQKIAAEQGLQWGKDQQATREETSVAPEILNTLFKMPRPTGDDPSYDAVLTPAGDFVVLSLKAVTDPEPPTSEAESIASLRSTLRQDYGQQEFGALMQGLRQQAEIEVFRDNVL